MGVAIAKKFGEELYQGEVVGRKRAMKEDEVDYFTVEYEDGDVEDFDEKELFEAMNLAKNGPVKEDNETVKEDEETVKEEE